MSNYEKNLKDNLQNIKLLSNSESKFLRPWGRSGPVIAKIPIVISNTRIEQSIQANIELNDSIYEIQGSQSKVFLTCCKLLNSNNLRSGTIYISGYVKETIEYTLYKDNNDSKKVRFTTVKIPFEISSNIDYYFRPKLNNKGIKSIKLIGTNTDINELNNIMPREYTIGGMYCDVAETNIIGKDITLEPGNKEKNTNITEHFIVSISFVLLQNQLVNIK